MNTRKVSAKLKELVIVRTSQINHCEYKLASHKNLLDFRNRDDFALAVKAALESVERATRDPHEVDNDFWAELRQFYDEGEIIQLLTSIGLFKYFNRFNDALRLEPTK